MTLRDIMRSQWGFRMEIGQVRNFLEEGAFYREAPDLIHVWYGARTGPDASASAGADLATLEFWGHEPQPKSFEHHEVFTHRELLRLLESQMGRADWKVSDFQPPQRELFEKSFQETQGRIQREEIDKAVVIGTATAPKIPEPAERAGFLAALLKLPLSLYVYGAWDRAGGVLGATPELLFKNEDGLVTSMALAGSCPKADAGERLPLLRDPKEMREHQMVVQDISERLKPFGWLKASDVEVVELPTLFHLRTTIELSGNRAPDFELIRRMHPTAAMGQFPRNYGLTWMRDLPYQMQRGLHGGVVWFRLAPEKSVALVAIRSLFWGGGQSWLTAGCGIVRESQADREWREMEIKLESITRILGLAGE